MRDKVTEGGVNRRQSKIDRPGSQPGEAVGLLSLVPSSADLSLCPTSAGTLTLCSGTQNPTCSSWAPSVSIPDYWEFSFIARFSLCSSLHLAWVTLPLASPSDPQDCPSAKV